MRLARTPDSPFFLWKQSSWCHLSLTDTSACYHHLVVSITTLYRHTVVLIYAIITEESGHFGTPAFQISVRDQRRWEHYKSSQNGWQLSHCIHCTLCIPCGQHHFILPKRRFGRPNQHDRIHVGNNISATYPRRIGQGLNAESCILSSMLSSLMGLPNPAWVSRGNVVSHMGQNAFPDEGEALFNDL